jgi:hypothetical protein
MDSEQLPRALTEILWILGVSFGLHALLGAAWFLNMVWVRNPSMVWNHLYLSVTGLVCIKGFVEGLELFIILWSRLKGPVMVGPDFLGLLSLLYMWAFFAVISLISRGWCVTKSTTDLTTLDKQLVFLFSFGMTITELLSSGYNKIVTVCLNTLQGIAKIGLVPERIQFRPVFP